MPVTADNNNTEDLKQLRKQLAEMQRGVKTAMHKIDSLLTHSPSPQSGEGRRRRITHQQRVNKYL